MKQIVIESSLILGMGEVACRIYMFNVFNKTLYHSDSMQLGIIIFKNETHISSSKINRIHML